MAGTAVHARLVRIVKETVKPAPKLATRRQDVVDSMFSRTEVAVKSGTGLVYIGIVNRIMAEDGSGFRFMVKLHTGAEVYVSFPA